MQVTQTSNSRAFSYAANHTDNDTQMTRDRVHQYFQRHARNTQQCTARLSQTTRDRKYSPTHHSTSWRIAGPITAKSTSWLPDIVTSVTPPSTDGHVFVSMHHPSAFCCSLIFRLDIIVNMAAEIAIRTLYTRKGFSAAAAQSMVDEQGLTSLDDIKVLTDQRVESLYMSILVVHLTLAKHVLY
jgi:hypothetical protein